MGGIKASPDSCCRKKFGGKILTNARKRPRAPRLMVLNGIIYYICVNSVSARCLIAAGLLLKASHRKRTAWEALGRALLSNLHW